jgi:nucleoside-diphosphate-sugar epimerase
MQNVLIIGGGGMVGQKLAWRLARDGGATVTLFDMFFPEQSAPGKQVSGNVAEPGTMAGLIDARPDVIYHLASVVSGEAEQDYAKGWAVNMFPMWELIEAIRAAEAYCPRLVFTSSIAVFGGPYPEVITDEFFSVLQTSYGNQKLVCERLLGDATRKVYVDGISIRLPTICVRPGKPNAAASGFFSGIIREPLNGQEAVLPVSDTVRHTHASPRAAVGFLTHAAGLDLALLEGRNALNMPGVSVTVAEQIEALRRVAGDAAVRLIKPQHDPAVDAIVAGWPRNFDPVRARALGFKAEARFDEIVQVYIEDELGGAAG